MSNIIDKLSKFNYTKTGVIVGLILGTMMISIGIMTMMTAIKSDDFYRKISSVVVIGIGVGCISMEIYRARKLKSKK